MKKIITFTVIVSCVFLYNCENTGKQKVKEKSDEKECTSNTCKQEDTQKKIDLIYPSRVITYREIEQYLSDDSPELVVLLSEYFQNMLSPELRLLRNEFFARKGYIFEDQSLNNYFSQKSWYNPFHTAVDSIVFSNEEQQILDSLLFYERKNMALTNEMLKNKMVQLLREGKRDDSYQAKGYSQIYPSTALFRRNIGYLLVDRNNIENAEEDMYWLGYAQSLLLIDTVGVNKDILLMDYICSGSCDAEDCFWNGILFTVDLNFEKVIDFLPISFEDLVKTRQKNSLICTFKESNRIKTISIDPVGKITDYQE
ncbi:MAG: YARHG domain-containing protein [Bacteroidales bacterium]|nr:YARHG domain-containing protein [Bacteroidales bacterium]MCL2133330.1 YARHG domain-containing protein [Bacteroidales bacterium]